MMNQHGSVIVYKAYGRLKARQQQDPISSSGSIHLSEPDPAKAALAMKIAVITHIVQLSSNINDQRPIYFDSSEQSNPMMRFQQQRC
ncbi:hypothetical protein ACLOJK_004536 [Asimina triloba]